MIEVGGAKSPALHFLEGGRCSFLEPAHTSWYSESVGGDPQAHHGFSVEPQLSLYYELRRRENHIFVQ